MTSSNAISHSPFLKWVASTILVLIFIVPFISQQASAAEIFADVDASDPHYPGILEAYENGFLSRYPDGTFQPNLKLSRANVVKSLGKLVLVKSEESLTDFHFSKTAPFNDVPPTFSDRELFEYSIIVKEAGIFTGSNNNLLPTNLMTRQQMAKVLVNAFNLDHVEGKHSKVIDNHLAGSEFRGYIDILSKNNVTTVTNFRPGETTTRGQFATFLTNANNAANNNSPVVPNPEVPGVPDESELPPMPELDPREPEPEPEVLPPAPLFVKESLPINFSEIQIIDLPKTVKVVYSDTSEHDYAVIWDKKGSDLKVGSHNLVGKVANTNFSTHLIVHVHKFTMLPGLPGKPIIYTPIPAFPPAEYHNALTLINKLPQDVKNADNALAASQKWALADAAVTVVKDKYNYNLSAWDAVLTAQTAAIQKRQNDINAARADATITVHNLKSQIKYAKSDITAQGHINAAKAKINALKVLDKKAETTAMNNDINKHQKIVDDLKIVLAAIDEKNMSASIPNSDSLKPVLVLKNPQDTRVDYLWIYAKGSQYIESRSNELLRDPSFFSPKTRNIDVVATVWKGSVTAARTYSYGLTPPSSRYQFTFHYDKFLVIAIEMD